MPYVCHQDEGMRETWTALVESLRGVAHLLGCEEQQVRRGRFGEQTLRAPFVLVYLLPGRSAEAAEAGATAGTLAYTLDVFVGVEPSADLADALCVAVERAVAAMDALSLDASLHLVFDDDPITLDTSTNAFTAVRIGATVYP